MILILVTLRSNSDLVNAARLSARLFTAPRRISINVNRQDHDARITDHVNSFQLRKSNEELINTSLSVTVRLSTVKDFRRSSVNVFRHLRTYRVVVHALRTENTMKAPLLRNDNVRRRLVTRISTITIITRVISLPSFVSEIQNFQHVAIDLMIRRVRNGTSIFTTHSNVYEGISRVLIRTRMSVVGRRVKGALTLVVRHLCHRARSQLRRLIVEVVRLRSVLCILVLCIVLRLASRRQLAKVRRVNNVRLQNFLPLPTLHVPILSVHVPVLTARLVPNSNVHPVLPIGNNVRKCTDIRRSLILRHHRRILTDRSDLSKVVSSKLLTRQIFGRYGRLQLLFLSRVLLRHPYVVFHEITLRFRLVWCVLPLLRVLTNEASDRGR